MEQVERKCSKKQKKEKGLVDKVSATKYYEDLINKYNKIPLVEKMNPDLNEYASQKASDGLFMLIEKEEGNIRDNPAARVNDILKKVFAQASN